VVGEADRGDLGAGREVAQLLRLAAAQRAVDRAELVILVFAHGVLREEIT